MNLSQLLNNKALKPKEKSVTISQALLDETLNAEELIVAAHIVNDTLKATCIEALEFVTEQQPTLINLTAFRYVTHSLSATAPRIQWESARVIGNTAALFPDELNAAIKPLIKNAKKGGNVVRWSAAFALGEILKLETECNITLLPAMESLCLKEEKNSIQKVYQAAMKKIKK